MSPSLVDKCHCEQMAEEHSVTRVVLHRSTTTGRINFSGCVRQVIHIQRELEDPVPNRIMRTK